ncbi:hypothetical protein RHMOL_Rhmol06G0183100 [Rhododendron molle]|uniref:Uncharacterized protein n=3 Tax=Rhododendron molle TaxID=49168 RepID=A0ACC0NDV1_RHOML|nr:hypothetical protein RHMOL_Rhmol06G0183100 [Rhododendron molle]KAI8551400.1 hypothetical protein RHMOL_Rhmol06G0183100 [Rhododendron molle]KAI8551401.1 hypothetical protein RHMOL_Rhmol06G0183100 [Rhododendron molle]
MSVQNQVDASVWGLCKVEIPVSYLCAAARLSSLLRPALQSTARAPPTKVWLYLGSYLLLLIMDRCSSGCFRNTTWLLATRKFGKAIHCLLEAFDRKWEVNKDIGVSGISLRSIFEEVGFLPWILP